MSASASSVTNGCCSATIPESRIASYEYGSKGVTIGSGPASLKSVEKVKIDLGLDRLRRRRKKEMMPITAKMAATPPMTPPSIAPVFLLCDGEFVFPVVPLAFIVCTGTL